MQLTIDRSKKMRLYDRHYLSIVNHNTQYEKQRANYMQSTYTFKNKWFLFYLNVKFVFNTHIFVALIVVVVFLWDWPKRLEFQHAVLPPANSSRQQVYGREYRVHAWKHWFKVCQVHLLLLSSPFICFSTDTIRRIITCFSNSSVANALRRVCIAEVPVMGKQKNKQTYRYEKRFDHFV